MNEENIITERRDEVHGKNQIILTVYRTAQNRYTYSIQMKVGKIIKSIFPHQMPKTWDSAIQAKNAAFYTMLSWTKNSRSAKKSLFDFEIMNVDQLSLFDESDLLQPVPASS